MSSASQGLLAHIEEILQQLDDAEQDSVDDRRTAPRLRVRLSLTATVLSDANPAPIPIHSRNFSVGGIGFLSRRMFTAGERIAVPLKLPNGKNKLVLAQVTFARYVRKGLHEAGAEFLEAIDDPTGEGRVPASWMFGAPTGHQDAAVEGASAVEAARKPPAAPIRQQG